MATSRCVFKTWFELNPLEKQRFAEAFIETHEQQYPLSKSNGSLRALCARQDTLHSDSPSLFSVFYHDISANRCRRFNDPSFQRLLVQKH